MTKQRSVKTKRLCLFYGPNGWEPGLLDDEGRLKVNTTITLDETNLNVTAKNVKSYTDIANIGLGDYTGIVPPDPPASITLLTAEQIRALFDQDITSTYTIDENQGLITMFKMPNYVYDLEVIGADGYELEGDFYPIYTDGRATVVSRDATSLKVEAKLSGFIFVSRNSVTYTVSKIIVREMTDARVNSPMWQPLNTNELREVVWEQIDLDNSTLQTIEIALGTYRDHYDITKSMFDKNVNTVVPATEQFQIEQNFKKPINIAHFKMLTTSGISLRLDQWQLSFTLVDGRVLSYQGREDTPIVINLNEEVQYMQFQGQYGGSPFEVAEIVMTIAHTEEISSSEAAPVDSNIRKGVLLKDMNDTASNYNIGAGNIAMRDNLDTYRNLYDKNTGTNIAALTVHNVRFLTHQPIATAALLANDSEAIPSKIEYTDANGNSYVQIARVHKIYAHVWEIKFTPQAWAAGVYSDSAETVNQVEITKFIDKPDGATHYSPETVAQDPFLSFDEVVGETSSFDTVSMQDYAFLFNRNFGDNGINPVLPNGQPIIIHFKAGTFVKDVCIFNVTGVPAYMGYTITRCDGTTYIVNARCPLIINERIKAISAVLFDADSEIREIQIRRYDTHKVFAQYDEPVNTNEIGEVCLDMINLQDSSVTIAGDTQNWATYYAEVRKFLDKDTSSGTTTNQIIVVPRKPINIGEVKVITAGNLALTVNDWTITLVDGTVLTAEDAKIFVLNYQVASIQIDFDAPQDVREIIMTVAHTTEISSDPAAPVFTSGPLTDTELRATAVPVTVAELLGVIIEEGSLGGIDHFHRKIHEKKAFKFWHDFGSIGNGVTVRLHIETGVEEFHLNLGLVAAGLCDIILVEGSTFTLDGTGLTVYNKNRSAPITAPLLSAWHTPTVNVAGATVDTDKLPSGTTPQTRLGTQLRPGSETILAPSTHYTYDITNNSGAPLNIFVAVEGYEES